MNGMNSTKTVCLIKNISTFELGCNLIERTELFVSLQKSVDLSEVYSKGEGDVSILWRFDPFLSCGLPLRGFAITHFEQTTYCSTSPDE